MCSVLHRSTVRLTSVLLLATLGAACQDSPTLPSRTSQPAPAAARLNQGEHLGEVPFYCAFGRVAPASPTGWETRRLTLFVPRGELDAAGRTIRYEYRRSSLDGRLVAVASCTVPYTEGALRRVDRALGVRENGGAEQFRARQAMITTQGCVTSPDSACAVDPIIVIAPPRDRTTEVQCGAMDPNCGNSGGEDGWGSGSWGGGGGADDAYSEGPIAFGFCVGALAGLMIGTVSLRPYMDAVYFAAGAVDSERRMLNVVTQNGGSPEMIQVYQSRYDAAVSSYNGAVNSLANAGAVTAGAILVAVVACSPAMLLPA